MSDLLTEIYVQKQHYSNSTCSIGYTSKLLLLTKHAFVSTVVLHLNIKLAEKEMGLYNSSPFVLITNQVYCHSDKFSF